jgi:hypothetical protein
MNNPRIGTMYARVAGSGDRLVPAKDCPRKGCDGGLILNKDEELVTCPRCKGVGSVPVRG